MDCRILKKNLKLNRDKRIEMLIGMVGMEISEFDVDNFENENTIIFKWQEHNYGKNELFRIFSLISIFLIDLGLVFIQREDV